jgi:hypothetical protein
MTAIAHSPTMKKTSQTKACLWLTTKTVRFYSSTFFRGRVTLVQTQKSPVRHRNRSQPIGAVKCENPGHRAAICRAVKTEVNKHKRYKPCAEVTVPLLYSFIYSSVNEELHKLTEHTGNHSWALHCLCGDLQDSLNRTICFLHSNEPENMIFQHFTVNIKPTLTVPRSMGFLIMSW